MVVSIKILLTGGSGFIGRNLKEQLGNDYEIDAPSHDKLDLLNLESVGKYLKNKSYNILIHAAVATDVEHQLTDYQILDGNLRMYYNLEHYKKYFDKIYCFGSGAEYHQSKMRSCVSENDLGKFIPEDPYGFSKYIITNSIKSSDNIYDLTLFGVFGKYEVFNRRFISNAICRRLKGLPILINQNVYFDYLYIDDLVKIMRCFIEKKPEFHHYNVCSGKRTDLFSLAKIVNSIDSFKTEIKIKKTGMKHEYSGDNSRLVNEFKNIHFTEYSAAIKELYDFYKDKINLIEEEML